MLFQAEPYRLISAEIYSTLLWHIGDTPALSHLSQHLMSIDREATQTWIAAGNSFSLQKEHDQAMRCFKRATQIDPSCAYAWTLCGYEAMEMEDYERALGFYRAAIRNDARHYNAWYGSSHLNHAQTDFAGMVWAWCIYEPTKRDTPSITSAELSRSTPRMPSCFAVSELCVIGQHQPLTR